MEIKVHNLRDYTTNRYRKVDDYPFGGEAGMVMQIEPVDRAISSLKAERHYDEVIFTSPDGEPLTQPMANSMSMLDNIIILCGHYKGVDQRIREHLVTREITIGDYVCSPEAKCPALIITDAIVRLIPGAIGDEQSALSDSFQDGLLAPPIYTRPAEYKGWRVPDILLSGHQARIDEWRHEQAIARTRSLRPNLLRTWGLTDKLPAMILKEIHINGFKNIAEASLCFSPKSTRCWETTAWARTICSTPYIS